MACLLQSGHHALYCSQALTDDIVGVTKMVQHTAIDIEAEVVPIESSKIVFEHSVEERCGEHAALMNSALDVDLH